MKESPPVGSDEAAAAGPPLTVEELVLGAQGLVVAVFSRLRAEGLRGERDDLMAFGQQGLIEAAQRYEPERGEFRRFAYYRVRGAMIDGVRKMGSWSRRGYERVAMMRAMDGATESLADGETSASQLTSDQAAERLRQHMASVVTAVTVGVFAEPAYEGEGIAAKDPAESAEEQMQEQQMRAVLREALAALPEPEGTVVRRMYLEDHRLDDIASDLGCSKSWASRLHTRALKKLGARLRDQLR